MEEENTKAKQHIEDLKCHHEDISKRVSSGISRLDEMKARKAQLIQEMGEM
jgi:predicted  nucleic acid-binding Zn-ribbon protein